MTCLGQLGSPCDLDPRSNFKVDLSKPNYISFDQPEQEKMCVKLAASSERQDSQILKLAASSERQDSQILSITLVPKNL